MAKQHRMVVMILGCAASAIETAVGAPMRSMTAALVVVTAGAIVTSLRRAVQVVRRLEAR
jgi:hypothetical protein